MAVRNILVSKPFTELKTVQDITQKIEKRELVLILFNELYADQHSIEHKFNSWRKKYEDKHNLYVYKCVIDIGESPFQTKYNIGDLPTFIFFRNGIEAGRLTDAENVPESMASPSNNTEKDKPNEELRAKKAEEQLISWLDKCLR